MPALGHAAPLHLHGHRTEAALGDAPVESAPAIGAHPALQAMSQVRGSVHGINLRATWESC